MSTFWRPAQCVRPIAIGIVRRGDALLVVAVRDDAGDIKGWRPIGGTIAFGERAADALQREFMEELGEAIENVKPVAAMENIYQHHGTLGHEIVFVFEAAFSNAHACHRESFEFQDGGVDNTARWIALARFRSSEERLFPAGLLEQL
jgi:ADP-ribose pyrophosphatase YjhB (NUDIX family)